MKEETIDGRIVESEKNEASLFIGKQQFYNTLDAALKDKINALVNSSKIFCQLVVKSKPNSEFEIEQLIDFSEALSGLSVVLINLQTSVTPLLLQAAKTVAEEAEKLVKSSVGGQYIPALTATINQTTQILKSNSEMMTSVKPGHSVSQENKTRYEGEINTYQATISNLGKCPCGESTSKLLLYALFLTLGIAMLSVATVTTGGIAFIAFICILNSMLAATTLGTLGAAASHLLQSAKHRSLRFAKTLFGDTAKNAMSTPEKTVSLVASAPPLSPNASCEASLGCTA